MADPSPFTPGASVTLAVSTSTARVALPTGAGTRFLLQTESGNAVIYFLAGSVTVVATTAGTPMLADKMKVFTLDPGATYIAAICANNGETGNLHITRGEGA